MVLLQCHHPLEQFELVPSDSVLERSNNVESMQQRGSITSAMFSYQFSYLVFTAVSLCHHNLVLALSIQPTHRWKSRAISAVIALLVIPFECSANTVSDSLPLVAPESAIRQGKVTSKVYLDVSIARSPVERITLGIYGDDAPAASKFFLNICESNYGDGVSYDGAQVSRIQMDRRIDIGKLSKGGNKKQETWIDGMGKMRIRSVSLSSKLIHSDINDLRHDTPGIISVRKGGGTFDFTIASKINPKLDSENIVIGKVLDGMDIVNKINKIPVSKEDIIGSKGTLAAFGKGFDGRAKLAAVEKPLQRVSVLQCKIAEKASITSFLKF